MRQKKRSQTGEDKSGRLCWCGEGFLETVEMNGVGYLYCDVCGGELDR